MLLLTGATGTIGSALLRRLTARRTPVRVLVRDPRRLGPERVRVQIALGDLGDPASFRHALRGVRTVVHLAGSARDQPSGTIEELNALATWRLLRAAEAARVRHFLFIGPLGATPHHPSRFHRAKWLAARAVATADVPTTTLHCAFTYAADSGWLLSLERLGLLPAVPLAGSGRARSQPIWAPDVAEVLLAAIDGGAPGEPQHADYEIAGPDVLSHRRFVELALTGARRDRTLIPLPLGVLRSGLKAYEALAGPAALTTWTEAELLARDSITPRGTADAEALGVRPHRAVDVLSHG